MMRSLLRFGVAASAAAFSLALLAAPAGAATGFQPPPGCTGSWNTTQSANNNQAPGVAPGCTVAVTHVPTS
jgi:hypothetical protein